MERLRRRPLPVWPEPRDSLGRQIDSRVKGSLVWFARGPAQKRYNEVMRPEVENILNNIELPEGPKLLLKLYMIGSIGQDDEPKANPIIMICCPHKETCEEAIALIRKSGLLEREEHRGFGLGSNGFPLETSGVPRPLGKGIYLDIDPTTEAALKVDVYGLSEPGIGRKLGFVASSQSSWTVQYATGGPVVYLGDHLYQLTVAHAAKPSSGSKAAEEQGSNMFECEFDGQFEEDDDEHMILSRGSVSPGGPLRDSEHESDQQTPQQSSAYSDSYPETPDTRQFQSPRMSSPMMSPKSVEMAEDNNDWKFSTLMGSFPMPDGYGGELDYLLVKLPEESPRLAKGLNEVALDEPFRSRSVHVHDIASTKDAEVSIFAITSRGPIRGDILADAVSFKIRKSCSFQQLLTVSLSEGLREGDSGSALIDAQTGDFYGYVILGVDGDCVAYALPSPMVMAKITTQFQHLPSFRLPKEYESSSSRIKARLRSIGSPTRQAWSIPPSSTMPSIPEGLAQSSSYMVPPGDHITLQRDLLDARMEVQRLNTELRNRRSELEGSRGELLDPALIRDMQTAISDQRFRDELNSLERWFYVVGAGQQSVALHTLLQNANPAHVDYIRHVLRHRGFITPLSEVVGKSSAVPDTSESSF